MTEKFSGVLQRQHSAQREAAQGNPPRFSLKHLPHSLVELLIGFRPILYPGCQVQASALWAPGQMTHNLLPAVWSLSQSMEEKKCHPSLSPFYCQFIT